MIQACSLETYVPYGSPAVLSNEMTQSAAMPREFFDPTPEAQNVVLINAATLRKAEKLIESCEHCNEDGAEFPFLVLLDRVTGSNPMVTNYIIETPARCPGCLCEVLERTLIEPA
jgi:hypothetical protein